MKSISVAQAKSDIEGALNSAQKGQVVIMRAGRPSAVLIGVESLDAEDRELASSPQFWRMIEARRSGKSIPLSELKARLAAKKNEKVASKTTRATKGRRDK